MQFRYLIFAGVAAAAMIAASSITPPGTGAANAQGGVIDARSTAMKTLGGSLRRVGQAASAEDARGPAAAIAGAAARLESLFPEGSGGPPTRSKPEIWQNMADFKVKLAALKDAAQALDAAAKGSDLDAVKAAARNVGGTCGACHRLYRAPKS